MRKQCHFRFIFRTDTVTLFSVVFFNFSSAEMNSTIYMYLYKVLIYCAVVWSEHFQYFTVFQYMTEHSQVLRDR